MPLYNRRLRLNGLGGQDHACEKKAAAKKKSAQEHEEASEIGSGFVEACRES